MGILVPGSPQLVGWMPCRCQPALEAAAAGGGMGISGSGATAAREGRDTLYLRAAP